MYRQIRIRKPHHPRRTFGSRRGHLKLLAELAALTINQKEVAKHPAANFDAICEAITFN